MTKGIVGIQPIFGMGGVGQPSMIDIEMYKRNFSIYGLTTDPVSPTTATNFTFSGISDHLVGFTLILEYSTDGLVWSDIGTVYVQDNGSWLKNNCQIPTAGSYYLRARYETVVYSDSLSVVVASGATLTAYQFGATGAYKGDTAVTGVELKDNYIYVSGWTAGSTLFGESTGNGASSNRAFIAKFNKNYEKQWVKFFGCGDYGYRTTNKMFTFLGDNVFVFDRNSSTYPYNSTVYKLSLTDGSTVASLALTTDGGSAIAYGIGTYNSRIWVFGATGNSVGSYFGMWDINSDLNSQTLTKDTGYSRADGAIINGQYAWVTTPAFGSLRRVDLSAKTVGKLQFTGYVNGGKYDVSPTNDILLLTWSNGNQGYRYKAVKKTDPSTVHFDQQYTASSTTGLLYLGKVKHYDSKFLVWRNDGAKFILEKLNDATSYGLDSTIANITPYSLSGDIMTYDADCHYDSTHYVVVGKIKNGAMESGYTPVDTSKYEGFIKLIAKS